MRIILVCVNKRERGGGRAGEGIGGVIYLLVFNAQPTGTVTSRRYTLQNLLIFNNKA